MATFPTTLRRLRRRRVVDRLRPRPAVGLVNILLGIDDAHDRLRRRGQRDRLLGFPSPHGLGRGSDGVCRRGHDNVRLRGRRRCDGESWLAARRTGEGCGAVVGGAFLEGCVGLVGWVVRTLVSVFSVRAIAPGFVVIPARRAPAVLLIPVAMLVWLVVLAPEAADWIWVARA